MRSASWNIAGLGSCAGGERRRLVDDVEVVRGVAVDRERREHDDVRLAGGARHRLGGVDEDLAVGALALLDGHRLRGRWTGGHDDRVDTLRRGMHGVPVRTGEHRDLVAVLAQALRFRGVVVVPMT